LLNRQTDQSLLEQMRLHELEIAYRKSLFFFEEQDVQALIRCRPAIEESIDSLVDKFYELQTSVPEISLLIGDSDTLARLQRAQREYIFDLFSGNYDLEYVNNRLRIGLVHKRIGVEPKLYLSAIHTLTQLLRATIRKAGLTPADCDSALTALDKLISIDVTFAVETYIRSLMSEIELSKVKAEEYGRSMELEVKKRTRELEVLSRVDPLTGLLNVRYMEQIMTRILRRAQRRSEPVTAVYFDINDFKSFNDTQGHQRGDTILRSLGTAVKSIAREEDCCFRCGGDEFCVVMGNCRLEDAEQFFIARLSQQFKESEDSVSLSFGVAQTGPSKYVGARALIQEADSRMFTAKKKLKEKIRLVRN
jgi:diguanylate cyclase